MTRFLKENGAMVRKKQIKFVPYVVVLCLLMVSACSTQMRVRNLASDVCLIKENTGQEEVVELMGSPALTRTTSDGSVEWIYYEVKKSFLRKTPWVGSFLGYQRYDVVSIIFMDQDVRICEYRFLDEGEFQEYYLNNGEISVNE
ncbi:hypothetical protein ACFL6N_07140 [Thermodesulfobacteriota bacterium]